MRKIAQFIVRFRYLFTALFIGLMIFSVFSMNWTKVEDEIIEFLPDDAESKICLDIMDQEFTTYGTADIYMEKTDKEAVKNLISKIKKIEHVSEVEFDEKTDFNDGKAHIIVTFDAVAEDEVSEKALGDIQAITNTMDSVSVYSLVGDSISQVIDQQMTKVIIFVAVIVVIVLLLATETFGEVLVLLLTFIAAALINMGTNFIFGTISMISDSIAIVLQLALSLDYAVIFCNRYKEERLVRDQEDAVVTALAASIPAIAASSLTTVAGLFAITLMQFRLGADMGYVLIKAILLSLISVFLFMPGLLMYFGKLIEKTKHKRFIPKVPFIGKFAYKTRFIMPLIFVVLLAGGFYFSQHIAFDYDGIDSPSINQAEGDYAREKLDEDFGINTFAVLVPAGDYDSEKLLIKDLKALKEVDSVLGLADIEAVKGYKLGDKVNYAQFAEMSDLDEETSQAIYAYYAASQGEHRIVDTNFSQYKVPVIDIFVFIHDKCLSVDSEVELSKEDEKEINDLYDELNEGKKQLQGSHYSRIIVESNLPIQGDESYQLLDQVHVIAQKYYKDNVNIAGDSQAAYDFCKSFSKDNMIVTALSIIFVMIILFFTFKSVAMPLLLIFIIQGSIWINFGLATLQGNHVFFLCYLIVSAIQMGANIDYAIVISTRYLEFREKMDKKEAIIEAMNLAFPTILTSGSIMVIAGMLIGVMISSPYISGIGYYLSIGTLISICLVFFVLPQILVAGDILIQKTRIRLSEKFDWAAKKNIFKRVLGVLLGLTAIVAMVVIPFVYQRLNAQCNEQEAFYSEQLSVISELDKINESYKAKYGAFEETQYDFAEQYLTEKIGREELNEGKEDYNSGRAELARGQREYDEGKIKYAKAEKEYQDGKAKYESGLADYNQGKKKYADAEKQIQDAQKAYDDCLAYRERLYVLVEEGLIEESSLDLMISSFLKDYGYSSLPEVKADLDDGYVQLDKAKRDLAQAEIDLNDGKNKLVTGEKELADANKQLSDAEVQLRNGQRELNQADADIREGERLLDENQEKYAESLKNLDKFSETEKKLEAGTEALMTVPEIRALVKDKTTYSDICTAGKKYYNDQIEMLHRSQKNALLVLGFLAATALMALLGCMVCFIRKLNAYGRWVAILGFLFAVLCIVFWFIYMTGFIYVPICAGVAGVLILLIFAILDKENPDA